MSDETFETHPIQLIASLIERLSGLTLSFSLYFYRAQSPFDEREVFQQKVEEVTPEWLRSQIQKLRSGWEIALNSNVIDARGRAHHLPMIDFSKVSLATDDLLLMRSILGVGLCRQLVFFHSGRSLHAYGLHLLKPRQWREFMGRLLLLNLPHSEPLVDARWVGHRLVSGYSALRWSSNSSHYLRIPARARIDFSKPERGAGGVVGPEPFPPVSL